MRAIPRPELERQCAGSDIPPRGRALWRLLYDSAARADEVLGWEPAPGACTTVRSEE
jgi:hypothetical protein